MKIFLSEKQFSKIINIYGVLNEDITSGKFIVYHRTNSDPTKIVKKFIPKLTGQNIGYGFYASILLEDALSEQMREYGKYIIKYEIEPSNKFLIFTKKEQKIFYGREMSIKEQLKKILKGNYNYFYKKHRITLDYDDIDKEEDLAHYIINPMNGNGNLVSYLDGVISYTNNRKALVLYNFKLMNPISFSDDEGLSWKIFRNKDMYSDYNDYDLNYMKKNDEYPYIITYHHTNNDYMDEVEYYKFYKKLSKDVQKKIIIRIPNLVVVNRYVRDDFMKYASIDDINYILKNNGYFIDYLDNPTEEQQLMALNDTMFSFEYIKNPTDKAKEYYNKWKNSDYPSDLVRNFIEKN